MLVNNAGIVRSGSIEGLALEDFKATMETNYFGPTPLDSSLAAGHAKEAERVHYQRHVRGWPDRLFTAGAVYRLEICARGAQRSAGPGGETFNVRVAIVQPGIVDTAMARRIEDAPTDAAYPQVRRFGHMFEASLEKPTPPDSRRGEDREIIEVAHRSCGIRSGRTQKVFLAGARRSPMRTGSSGGRFPTKPGTSASPRTSASMQVPKRRSAAGASASAIGGNV